MLTINMGIERTTGVSRSHQRYWKQYITPNQATLSRESNDVPLCILNYVGESHYGVGSRNDNTRTMQYFGYIVFVS